MMIGKAELTNDGDTLETRNDTYSLMPSMHVSARPPFRAPGLVLAAGLIGFGVSFTDLAHPGELETLAGIVLAIVVATCCFTRLTLVDRDLKHSELAVLAWGAIWRLRAKQREIGAEIARIKRGGRS
ncbi:MAG: hypothetical protein AAF360_01585 [Pseudomonadota bacterium]